MNLATRIRSFFSKEVYISIANDEPVVENFDIRELYKTQANLRTVVSFITEQAAQLPIKCYERRDDNDRPRNTTCVTARLLARPNDYQTRYEFIEQSFSEFLLYGECVWFVHADATSPCGYSIDILPEGWLLSRSGGTLFAADKYTYSTGEGVIEVPAEQLVVFHNYNPSYPSKGVSPLHALRNTMLEQIESNRFRRQIWKNGGRMSAYISRPKDVEQWDDAAATRFKEDIKSNWTSRGSMAGGMPVLEDGMEIKTVGFSAREQEWSRAEELSREEICGVYHVSLSCIWNDNRQTYASAKDNSRALYADCLMPYLTRFSERINTFLLPLINEESSIYCEFDIQSKLNGSFEEQANYLTSSVGAPWLTRNEARARMNLPRVDDGDEIITPLNVAVGGSGYESTPSENQYSSSEPDTKDAEQENPYIANEELNAIRASNDALHARYVELFTKFYTRQINSVKSRYIASKAKKDASDWYDIDRWNRELSSDIMQMAAGDIQDIAESTLKSLGFDVTEFNIGLVTNFIAKMAQGRADQANRKTLEDILRMEQEGKDFDFITGMITNRAQESGSSLASYLKGFAGYESIRQLERNGVDTSGVTKTWLTTSRKPRPSHSIMNGQTVGWKERFSNGAYYPGDCKALDAADVCNCKCICRYSFLV